jgi:hypothetical protein
VLNKLYGVPVFPIFLAEINQDFTTENQKEAVPFSFNYEFRNCPHKRDKSTQKFIAGLRYVPEFLFIFLSLLFDFFLCFIFLCHPLLKLYSSINAAKISQKTKRSSSKAFHSLCLKYPTIKKNYKTIKISLVTLTHIFKLQGVKMPNRLENETETKALIERILAILETSHPVSHRHYHLLTPPPTQTSSWALSTCQLFLSSPLPCGG